MNDIETGNEEVKAEYIENVHDGIIVLRINLKAHITYEQIKDIAQTIKAKYPDTLIVCAPTDVISIEAMKPDEAINYLEGFIKKYQEIINSIKAKTDPKQA